MENSTLFYFFILKGSLTWISNTSGLHQKWFSAFSYPVITTTQGAIIDIKMDHLVAGPIKILQIDNYLLSIAGGSSRNVLFVGVDAPLAPPGQVLARVMFCQHWTIFSTLSRFPRDAGARVGTGWSLVSAAS